MKGEEVYKPKKGFKQKWESAKERFMQNPLYGAIIKRFMQNPLIYGLIITGIIGLFFPFLFWFFSPGKVADTDIVELEKKIKSVANFFSEAHNYIERVKVENKSWDITSSEKKALETIVYGKTSVISFSFLLFLIQAGFFFMLGIILERKLFQPRREKKEESAKKEVGQEEKVEVPPTEKSKPGTKDQPIKEANEEIVIPLKEEKKAEVEQPGEKNLGKEEKKEDI